MVDIDIGAVVKTLGARNPTYAHYAGYYAGDHRLAFATSKFREAFGGLFTTFADNLCAAIVDAVADRLEVTGFAVESGVKRNESDAWKIWTRNRMDRRAGEVHLEALMCGDAYVIVWPGADGKAVLYPQRAGVMTVGYDDEVPGKIAWAAKAWQQPDGRARVTLYYGDRIEKYVSRLVARGGLPESPAAYEPYVVEGELWPLLNPYDAVPVAHFANNAPTGAFGVSELRAAVPLQDALNKATLDMFVAMEFAAYPQRYATGLEVEVDPVTGAVVNKPFEPGVDRFWSVASELAKFGQFDAADLSQFLKVQDSLRLAMGRDTGTPLHYLMLLSDPPSGEALKTLEARFTKKVKDRQLSFGNAWEDAMSLALRIERRAPPTVALATVWADAAPRSERDLAETIEIKRRNGISRQQALREHGYTEQQIAQMLEESQPPPMLAPFGGGDETDDETTTDTE